VNKSTDEIEIKSCYDKLTCDFSHPRLDHIGHIQQGFFPISGSTVRLQINYKKKNATGGMFNKWTGTAQNGIFYKWTGTGLTAIGSMKEWNDAVHALSARRRLLKKH
jgi:hypothetical protein